MIYSGADLSALLDEAARTAYRENCTLVTRDHFEQAYALVRPSVSAGVQSVGVDNLSHQ